MQTATFTALKKNAEHPKGTAFGQAFADAFRKLERIPHKPKEAPKAPALPVRQVNGFKNA